MNWNSATKLDFTFVHTESHKSTIPIPKKIRIQLLQIHIYPFVSLSFASWACNRITILASFNSFYPPSWFSFIQPPFVPLCPFLRWVGIGMGFDLESLSEATSGAIGALVSTTVLYPLDTCKTKYQAENQSQHQRKYRFVALNFISFFVSRALSNCLTFPKMLIRSDWIYSVLLVYVRKFNFYIHDLNCCCCGIRAFG